MGHQLTLQPGDKLRLAFAMKDRQATVLEKSWRRDQPAWKLEMDDSLIATFTEEELEERILECHRPPVFAVGFMFVDWMSNMRRRIFTVVNVSKAHDPKRGLVYLYELDCEGVGFFINESELRKKVRK